MSPDVAVCGACKAQMPADLTECPDCGADQTDFDPEDRADRADQRIRGNSGKEFNAGVAGVLSFFIIGLGHLYIGKAARAIILFVGTVAIATALVLLELVTLWPLVMVVAPIVSAIDAYNQAQALNESG